MLTALPWIRFVHLVAAAVWTGGLLVLGALVMALRKEGAERAILQAAARQFARVSWVAMVIAVTTGLAQVYALHLPWTYQALQLKVGLVSLAVVLAAGHQLTARTTSPAARGVVQLLIMVVSLGIFAAAVHI